MWKYEVSNTDHTLMQGVELVNRLLLDEPETTIGIKYGSTADGRQAALHERSQKAGSGDPLKKTTLPGGSTAYVLGDKEEAGIAEEELGFTQVRTNDTTAKRTVKLSSSDVNKPAIRRLRMAPTVTKLAET